MQVLDADGLGQDSDIIEGVVWAADHGADVILMSFSNPGFSPALQDAIDYAWDAGRGRRRRDRQRRLVDTDVPGRRREGRRRLGDRRHGCALVGLELRRTTPSSPRRASASRPTTPTARTSAITGTSASAALVAGAAALLKATDPTATNGVIVGRLARNADAAGTAEQTGNGRLNVGRAIADSVTDPVVPAGAAPVGGGGPLVGGMPKQRLSRPDRRTRLRPATGTLVDTWEATTRTGTISSSTASATVTGTGTSFLTELHVGDRI